MVWCLHLYLGLKAGFELNREVVVIDCNPLDVVALYGALLSMNERAGAEPADAVRNAGYVVYAYLGGQAKREITYTAD